MQTALVTECSSFAQSSRNKTYTEMGIGINVEGPTIAIRLQTHPDDGHFLDDYRT